MAEPPAHPRPRAPRARDLRKRHARGPSWSSARAWHLVSFCIWFFLFSGLEPRSPSTLVLKNARLRIAGIHHITLISANLERSAAFYRDLLGLRLVEAGVNKDDPGARHFWFGDADGAAGTLVSLFEYPNMEQGRRRRAPRTTSPSASRRGRAGGLAPLPDLAGRPCTPVLDRDGSSPSISATRMVTSWKSQRTCRGATRQVRRFSPARPG